MCVCLCMFVCAWVCLGVMVTKACYQTLQSSIPCTSSRKEIYWHTQDTVSYSRAEDTNYPFLLHPTGSAKEKIRWSRFTSKERSRRYSAQTITDADYADDIALLANAPAQDETLQHSLERAAAGISLYVHAHKTEYMRFNQADDISTINGSSLKLIDKFTYLGSSVSSTETDINTQLAKAWKAIDRISVIWKSDLTDKIKHSFFQATVTSILLYGCTIWTLNKRIEKKLDDN